MEKNPWNWFILFHEFFGLDLFNFSGPLSEWNTHLRGVLKKVLQFHEVFVLYKNNSWIDFISTYYFYFVTTTKIVLWNQNNKTASSTGSSITITPINYFPLFPIVYITITYTANDITQKIWNLDVVLVTNSFLLANILR